MNTDHPGNGSKPLSKPEEVAQRLAGLLKIDYIKARQSEATALGISPEALDKLVEQATPLKKVKAEKPKVPKKPRDTVSPSTLRSGINRTLRAMIYNDYSGFGISRAYSPLPGAICSLAMIINESLKFAKDDSREAMHYLCHVSNFLRAAETDIRDCVRFEGKESE